MKKKIQAKEIKMGMRFTYVGAGGNHYWAYTDAEVDPSWSEKVLLECRKNAVCGRELTMRLDADRPVCVSAETERFFKQRAAQTKD